MVCVSSEIFCCSPLRSFHLTDHPVVCRFSAKSRPFFYIKKEQSNPWKKCKKCQQANVPLPYRFSLLSSRRRCHSPSKIKSVEGRQTWKKTKVEKKTWRCNISRTSNTAIEVIISVCIDVFFCSLVKCLGLKQKEDRVVRRVMSHRKGALLRGLMFPGPFQFFHPGTQRQTRVYECKTRTRIRSTRHHTCRPNCVIPFSLNC